MPYPYPKRRVDDDMKKDSSWLDFCLSQRLRRSKTHNRCRRRRWRRCDINNFNLLFMLMITLEPRSTIDLAASPAFLPSHPHDEVQVKVLEEDFVEETRLFAGVRVVLLADSLHVKAADPPEACNGAAGAVLALVAVDHDGVVGAVHDQAQSSLHFAGVDAHFALVCANVDSKVLDASLVHERLVLRRDGLGDQGKDALDLEILDELVVFGLRVAAAVDASRDHSTVVQRRDAHVQAVRHNGSDGTRCDSASFGG